MNWGKSIVLVFVAFAMFIGVLVTVCVRQNISLVSKDYYKDELNYQQEIDELKNAATLKERPVIAIHNKIVNVVFSPAIEHGELKFQRPSDPRFDADFTVDSTKTFDMSEYPGGRYNLSFRWQMNGQAYLVRQTVNL